MSEIFPKLTDKEAEKALVSIQQRDYDLALHGAMSIPFEEIVKSHNAWYAEAMFLREVNKQPSSLEQRVDEIEAKLFRLERLNKLSDVTD